MHSSGFQHTQSRLKEILADADESKYSPRKIGKDKYGYTYLFFPTFLDFRLYKQKIKVVLDLQYTIFHYWIVL